LEFHFELRTLGAALAYPSQGVSWFTLSDGWFWITVGGDEVLRVDYQVDRFWEEVCELAPRVLRPVPPDLVRFAESDPERWRGIESDAAWSAELWHLGYRMFYREIPDVWSLRGWRTGDDFTITWPQGRTTVPAADFIASVRDFDARYRAAMIDRVAQLRRDHPEKAAHSARTLAEDAERHATRLEREFARPPLPEVTDLAVVRAGAAQLTGIGRK
jgi:hypothetical protein